MGLGNFFKWCSGASVEIVNMCDDKEQSKYLNIGIVVFAVSLLSVLSSTYFLTFAFDRSGLEFNPWFLPIGFIWGFIILSLDRAIVSTINKADSTLSQILKSIPRLLLSLTIGIILATPLELSIFSKEVNTIIDNNVLEIVKTEKEEYFKTELKLLETKVQDAEKAYLNDKQMYEDEVTGRKSGIPGRGSRANEYMANELKSLKAYNEVKLELEQFKEKIVEAEKQIDFVQEVKDYKNANIGIIDRVHVLYTIGTMHTIISVLFILIELLPLLIKLLSTKGSYDEITVEQHILKVEEAKAGTQMFIKKLNEQNNTFDKEKQLEVDDIVDKYNQQKELERLDFEHKHNLKQEENRLDQEYHFTRLRNIHKNKMNKLKDLQSKKEIKNIVDESSVTEPTEPVAILKNKEVQKIVDNSINEHSNKIDNKKWKLEPTNIIYTFKKHENKHNHNQTPKEHGRVLISDNNNIKTGLWSIENNKLFIVLENIKREYNIDLLTSDELSISNKNTKEQYTFKKIN